MGKTGHLYHRHQRRNRLRGQMVHERELHLLWRTAWTALAQIFAIRMVLSGGNVTALCSSVLWLKIEIVDRIELNLVPAAGHLRKTSYSRASARDCAYATPRIDKSLL
jgi:hypothetical protein